MMVAASEGPELGLGCQTSEAGAFQEDGQRRTGPRAVVSLQGMNVTLPAAQSGLGYPDDRPWDRQS